MKNAVYTSDDLQMRIAALETLALQQQEDLRDTASGIIHDLKPVNLIKNAFTSTVKSPGFTKNLFKGALGLAAGFLSKKIFVMGSTNVIKKAIGTVVELGVAKVVANKADKITSSGIRLLDKARK